MFRFVSSKNQVELKKDYLSLYNVELLQKKLDKLLAAFPDIKAVLPNDITAKKLLVGNFKYLAKVYCAFTSFVNGKTDLERVSVRTAFVSGGFKYNNHKIAISKFFMNDENGFEIHNCVYCDLEDVTTFIKANGTKVRKFETEHVLDKGECPLVALSLYNFVPSCGTCNGPAVKGTKTIGDTESEIVKLSPSAEGYDFDEKVKFEVKFVNPGTNDLNALSHPDDYLVDFDVKEVIYQKTIDLFELKPRYNSAKEKLELLFWHEKRKNNPDNIVQQFADLSKVSFAEMFEQMFQLDLRRRGYYPMEKARREVMLM